jgi:uncharacterized membrane protein
MHATLHCYLFLAALLQIEAQLAAVRADMDQARSSADAAQQELSEERRSRLAAEKLVAELRSKLDSVKAQAATGAPAAAAPAAGEAAAAAAAESGNGETFKVPAAAGAAGGKKGGKRGNTRSASPTSSGKGFGNK